MAGSVLSQVMLAIDRWVDAEKIPRILITTVDSGRSILTALAGGLITSVTLLLSMMLVAVQLASSQFSPRTVRNWIDDRTQQTAIGLVLGTTIYCLLILRETRSFGDGDQLTPHLSILLALLLGVLSLIAVVRSVDLLTNRLRVGSVASGIMNETLAVVEVERQLRAVENPATSPAGRPAAAERVIDRPPDAVAVTAATSGWIQQIDETALFNAIPEGSTVHVVAALGSFVIADTPVLWLWPPPPSNECLREMQRTIAVGDARTLQQDIGFGIMQMVDIALRALSPGVNDPNTANDLTMHLGVVILALWDMPISPTTRSEKGRSMIRHDLDHADYLRAAFDPIRRYGSGDPEVCSTLIRVLATLHSETKRRELRGPLKPIEDLVERVIEAVDHSDLSEYDKQVVRQLASGSFPQLDPAAEPKRPRECCL